MRRRRYIGCPAIDLFFLCSSSAQAAIDRRIGTLARFGVCRLALCEKFCFALRLCFFLGGERRLCFARSSRLVLGCCSAFCLDLNNFRGVDLAHGGGCFCTAFFVRVGFVAALDSICGLVILTRCVFRSIALGISVANECRCAPMRNSFVFVFFFVFVFIFSLSVFSLFVAITSRSNELLLKCGSAAATPFRCRCCNYR